MLVKQLYTGVVPRKALAMADKRTPADFKDTESKVTVFRCTSSTGKIRQ